MTPTNHKNQTIITPAGLSAFRQIYDVFKNRDLLLTLTWRDLKVRYAQTLLGFAWSVFQPVFAMASLFIVFFKLAKISTENIPYLSFTLSGLIFWNYFYFVIQQSAVGMVAMQAVLKKIYFPRLSIPFSKALVGLSDWLVALVILIIVLLWQDVISAKILWSIPMLLLTMISALGIGMLISAFSIRYRDLQQITPFFLQMLFFITPVAYPSGLLQNMLPKNFDFLVYLNPISGILELWRHLLFNTTLNPHFYISIISGSMLFIFGLIFFSKTSKKIADIL